MSLIELEGKEILINDDHFVDAEVKKGNFCLVGNLHVERIINKNVVKTTMSKIWRAAQTFTFIDTSPNIFIIKFEDQADIQ